MTYTHLPHSSAYIHAIKPTAILPLEKSDFFCGQLRELRRCSLSDGVYH